MEERKRWLSRAVVGLLLVGVVAGFLVVDIRPTERLKALFLRYPKWERLGSRYTSWLNPVFQLLWRPTAPLPELVLTVPEDEVVKMLRALPWPYSPVFLTRNRAVQAPARLKMGGREYQVEVRFRGKSWQHWSERKKSLRIDAVGDQYPQGLATIHLVIPEEREYLNALVSAKIARDLGLVVPNCEFVWLDFNGEQGVYLLVEDQNSGMIERNKLIPGNLYRENELGALPAFPFLRGGVDAWRLVEQEVGRGADFGSIELLLKLTNEADEETFIDQLPTLVDVDQFLRWQAHSVLVSSNHQDDRHNMSLLQDAASGKLVFFPTDLGWFGYSTEAELREVLLAASYNELARRVLSFEPWRVRRDQMVVDYLRDHQEELEQMMTENTKQVWPWLAKDNQKLPSSLRVFWQIRERERFLRWHWDLLGRVLGEES